MKSGLPIDVHALLQGRVEALRLEYKSTWDRYCGSSALRTICAFANDLLNTNGGYIVLGVEEENGVPRLPPRGIPEAELERIQNELRGACNRIQPHYMPTIVPEQVGDRWVIIAWCPGGEGRPYEAPESLESGAPRHPYVREASSTREAKGELLRQLHEVSTRVPFDDRACYDATSHDILPALVHEHLHEVRSRLAGERIAPEELYRKLNLLKRVNGHEAPKNVALLFFSSEPRRWFRGARIEIAQFPEGKSGSQIIERNIDGPLPTMIRTALDYLRGLIPTEIRKLPDRAEALHISAWPFAAVEEALINAVHHRGYDVPDPVKVYILPDAMKIASYPGPVSGLSLKDLESGDPPPVPARNKRIAELLKDLQLAEARGTGIGKIRREMERNGSPPPSLRFDEDRTWFEVTLPIHPAFVRRESGSSSQPIRSGQPAPPEELVGRDELVPLLVRALESQSVLLLGPQGRGVSSVLGAIHEALSASNRRAVTIDLHGVDFVGGFVAALMDWEEKGRAEAPARDDQLQALAERFDRGLLGSLEALLDHLAEVHPDGLTILIDGIDEFYDRDVTRWEDQRSAAWPQVELLRVLSRRKHLRLLGTARSFSSLSTELQSVLSTGIRVLTVPPLGHAASLELSGRLLRGAGLPTSPPVLDLLAQLSAGIPGLLVALIHALRARQTASAEVVQELFDELATEDADRAGLRRRISQFLAYIELHCRMAGDPRRAEGLTGVLDAAADSPTGRRRLDLIANVTTNGRPRMQVLTALRELEQEGWLVEVDGVVRFEHPWLRDEWLRFRALPPASPSALPEDDVPF